MRSQLAAFVRYGATASAAAELDDHLATGLVARGWLPARAADELGLGLTWASARDEAGRERVLEGYYTVQLWEGLAVQVDVQHLHGPHFQEQDENDVLAGTVRLVVGL